MTEQRMKFLVRTAPTTVFRYRLPIVDRPTLRLPRFAQILSVGRSRDDLDKLDLWAAVDPDQDVVDARFAVVGTGGPLPTEPLAYIGTAEHSGGALIFHVFQLDGTIPPAPVVSRPTTGTEG